ncbi:MAG: PorT family protein [Tannerellaceae bacterium]|jgi:hypothetical protein|nr:PorT family protein [Tannerellaceae bacterium]
MRTSILIASFLVAATMAFTASAQRKVYFIPKAGLNVTTITKTGGDWTTGTNFGLGIEWLINPKIGIETGIYYSGYGTKNIDIANLNEKQTIELDYIQVPIAAKYYLYKGFNIFAGPQITYIINESVKPVHTSLAYNKDLSVNGLIGAGYQFKFGLTFSAAYILGVTSIAQPIYAANENTYNRRNQAFQFNMGWRF